MKDMLLTLSAKIQTLMLREEGQDLVEYALVVAIIALGAVTTMGTLASDLNSVFGTIANKLLASA